MDTRVKHDLVVILQCLCYKRIIFYSIKYENLIACNNFSLVEFLRANNESGNLYDRNWLNLIQIIMWCLWMIRTSTEFALRKEIVISQSNVIIWSISIIVIWMAAVKRANEKNLRFTFSPSSRTEGLLIETLLSLAHSLKSMKALFSGIEFLQLISYFLLPLSFIYQKKKTPIHWFNMIDINTHWSIRINCMHEPHGRLKTFAGYEFINNSTTDRIMLFVCMSFVRVAYELAYTMYVGCGHWALLFCVTHKWSQSCSCQN